MTVRLLTRFVLALLVMGVGVHAGILISYAIGMYPVLKFMPLRDFAVWWNVHDRTMAVRILQYTRWMWLVWALAIGLVAYLRRWNLLAPIVLALVLSLSETAVYFTRAVPVNQKMHELNSYSVDEDVIADLRQQIFKVLKTREWLAGAALFVLVMGVSFSGSRRPHLHDHRKHAVASN